MNTDFLEQLTGKLKVDKNAACRRAIERIQAMVRKRCDQGVFENSTAAELDFRKLVEQQGTCQKPKSASKTTVHKPDKGTP
jgi:hypothetical protein